MTQPWGETPATWTVNVGEDDYRHPDGPDIGSAPPLNLAGFNLTVGRAYDQGLLTDRQYNILLDDAETCGMGWLQRITRRLPWT